MSLSKKDVEHVALLSRLHLNDEEKEKYANELSRIFDYVEELQAVDTDSVPPTAHPLELKNVLREDSVRPSLSNEAALSNAPEKEDNCFRVPKIV